MLSEAEMRRLHLPQGATLANCRKQQPDGIGRVRYYYVDRPFKCKRCGAQEVWTTEKQRHWYEECAGPIEAVAVLCRTCRKGESIKGQQASPGAD